MLYMEIVISRGDVDISDISEKQWLFWSNPDAVDKGEIGEMTVKEACGEFWNKGTAKVQGQVLNCVAIGEEVFLLEVPDDFDVEMLQSALENDEVEWSD